jgi:hypothetical protein
MTYICEFWEIIHEPSMIYLSSSPAGPSFDFLVRMAWTTSFHGLLQPKQTLDGISDILERGQVVAKVKFNLAEREVAGG